MKGAALLLIISSGANAISIKSDPMFSSLGYETRHYKGEGDYDDYNVPNFGRDSDVITTLKNAKDAEESLGHNWDVLAPSPDPPKRNYPVVQLGRDSEINETYESIAQAEKMQEHKWTWKKQHLLDHLSNPVPPGSWPSKARYDDDIQTSLKNADDAESSTGKHWTGDGEYA